MILDATQILGLHRTLTDLWHEKQEAKAALSEVLSLVQDNHRHNFALWHEEDKARRDDLGPEYVRDAKRNIDRYNQLRNDAIEAMDRWLYASLAPDVSGKVAFHSETPGMIIDRLSILELKETHMEIQSKRQDAEPAHRERCSQRLEVLRRQRRELGSCLQELVGQVQARTRSFRIYYQMKMYNDPSLNPALYKQKP